ncbi:hypothetical protein [Sphingomonas solaris]|uniref:Uncharacterized protein n=1 Tax=Alterirhizorhabdus solaris TaxID=2529389 RepID=A0A558R831_9SPHN|nr:hypothetical protein [Sphingomonas solaris]TVV75544.1 hypothetical protein FOY91_06700 [Sphingomonas solaris]
MPFDPALDAPGLREQTVATWSNPSISLRYPSARDAQADPAAGFFDTIVHAQVMVDARAVLLGVERRRFVVLAQDVIWLDPSLGLPSVTLTDAEQGAGGTFIVTRIEVNLEAGTTTLELFG